MKFILEKASDWSFREIVEVNNLSDLDALSKKYPTQDSPHLKVYNPPLVNDFTPSGGADGKIIVYDFYLE